MKILRLFETNNINENANFHIANMLTIIHDAVNEQIIDIADTTMLTVILNGLVENPNVNKVEFGKDKDGEYVWVIRFAQEPYYIVIYTQRLEDDLCTSFIDHVSQCMINHALKYPIGLNYNPAKIHKVNE